MKRLQHSLHDFVIFIHLAHVCLLMLVPVFVTIGVFSEQNKYIVITAKNSWWTYFKSSAPSAHQHHPPRPHNTLMRMTGSSKAVWHHHSLQSYHRDEILNNVITYRAWKFWRAQTITAQTLNELIKSVVRDLVGGGKFCNFYSLFLEFMINI